MMMLLGLIAWLAASPAALEQADAHFKAQQWQESARAYGAIVKEDPDNGVAWFRLGFSYQSQEMFREASEAYAGAERSGMATPILFLNEASVWAELKDTDRAVDYLDKAVEQGLTARTLAQIPDIETLRGHERFAGIEKRARINEAPCEMIPEHRQFDFWIGEWDVFGAQGNQVGTNRIERTPGGCSLIENWTSASGGTGESFNYYDTGRSVWVQVWVDSSGGLIPTEGRFEDGAMRLSGEHRYRNGRRELIRGAWTPMPDGRVRQFLEQSRDEGKTWYVWFDGMYVRRDGE